jgi:5-methylcytosine-specific restriction endonuclease McrBC regulatory subunit McrC
MTKYATAKGVRNAAFKLSIEVISHCKTIPEAKKKLKSFMKDLDNVEKEYQARVEASK